MSHELARELVIGTWKAIWDASDFSQTKVDFQNRRFTKPPTGEWARLNYAQGDSEPFSVGRNDERTAFVLTLQYFIPENTGTVNAYRARDALKGLNRKNVSLGNIFAKFGTVGISEAPTRDGLAAFNVTVRGYHDIHDA